MVTGGGLVVAGGGAVVGGAVAVVGVVVWGLGVVTTGVGAAGVVLGTNVVVVVPIPSGNEIRLAGEPIRLPGNVVTGSKVPVHVGLVPSAVTADMNRCHRVVGTPPPWMLPEVPKMSVIDFEASR